MRLEMLHRKQWLRAFRQLLVIRAVRSLLLKNGETGFVAENFEEFVQFSVELMDNSPKMTKMKQLAREVVLSRSWDTVFEKVYEAYNETIKIAEGKKINTAKQN